MGYLQEGSPLLFFCCYAVECKVRRRHPTQARRTRQGRTSMGTCKATSKRSSQRWLRVVVRTAVDVLCQMGCSTRTSITRITSGAWTWNVLGVSTTRSGVHAVYVPVPY